MNFANSAAIGRFQPGKPSVGQLNNVARLSAGKWNVVKLNGAKWTVAKVIVPLLAPQCAMANAAKVIVLLRAPRLVKASVVRVIVRFRRRLAVKNANAKVIAEYYGCNNARTWLTEIVGQVFFIQ